MAFEGDLQKLPLTDILRSVNANRMTGTLTLREATRERRIAFMEGLIVAFRQIPGPDRPTFDMLVRRRLVVREEAERARSGYLASRQPLRRVLSQRGILSDEKYQQAVEEEVLDHVYECFLEPKGTFRFEDEPFDSLAWDPDQIAANLRLESEPIVLEAAHHLDEWRRVRAIAGSMEAKLVREPNAPPVEESIAREALSLADGMRSLEEILGKLPTSRLNAMGIIAGLVTSKRIRKPGPVTAAFLSVETTLAALGEAPGLFGDPSSRDLGTPQTPGVADRKASDQEEMPTPPPFRLPPAESLKTTPQQGSVSHPPGTGSDPLAPSLGAQVT